MFAFPSFILALGSSDAEGYDVTSVETVMTGGSVITKEIHKAFMALPSVNTVINVSSQMLSKLKKLLLKQNK